MVAGAFHTRSDSTAGVAGCQLSWVNEKPQRRLPWGHGNQYPSLKEDAGGKNLQAARGSGVLP